jgi:hypothetical protein
MKFRELWVHMRTPCCGPADELLYVSADSPRHGEDCETKGNAWLTFFKVLVPGLIRVLLNSK